MQHLDIKYRVCTYSRMGGQPQGGIQVPPQVQMAVGRAVTNAAINELSNAFKMHK